VLTVLEVPEVSKLEGKYYFKGLLGPKSKGKYEGMTLK